MVKALAALLVEEVQIIYNLFNFGSLWDVSNSIQQRDKKVNTVSIIL